MRHRGTHCGFNSPALVENVPEAVLSLGVEFKKAGLAPSGPDPSQDVDCN